MYAPAEARVGPFLKWAGGKSQLLAQFERLLPPSLDGRGYVEPFMGSAAVFFHVARTRRPARATLLDANPELVNLFVRVRDDLDALIPALTAHRDRHNAPGISDEERRAYFYDVRAARPPACSVGSAARFLYLNKTCFNGLHRLNRRGEFNVPMGSYRAPKIFDAESLAAASRLLQGVRIEVADFRALDRYVDGGDFVYLDPPYEPLTATSSFTAYARDGFGPDDQAALRDVVEALPTGVSWMLSNSTAPLVESLYDRPGMYKRRVTATRAINSKAHARGAIQELVVTNYPVPFHEYRLRAP